MKTELTEYRDSDCKIYIEERCNNYAILVDLGHGKHQSGMVKRTRKEIEKEAQRVAMSHGYKLLIDTTPDVDATKEELECHIMNILSREMGWHKANSITDRILEAVTQKTKI